MLRSDWDRLLQVRQGEMVEVDLSKTPIGNVVCGCRIDAAVAVRLPRGDVLVEVYRYDQNDTPTPINLDLYRVWERLPSHRDYFSMVNSASTEDNSNMRGFLEDHVFMVKDVVGSGHWLRELPPQVKAVLSDGRGEDA